MALQYLAPLRKAAFCVETYMEELYSDWDVTANEAYALTHLFRYTPSPVFELYKTLGVKRSTLTSTLDRMESRDWIVRHTSPRDRRVVLVDLTENGRKQARHIQSAIEALETRIDTKLGSDELKGFTAVLAAITAATGGVSG